MTQPLDPDHVNWSRKLFRSLNEAGVWGVPRSGLVLTKRGTRMILTSRAPWTPSLGGLSEDWPKYQREDFLLIRAHFEAAGIQVDDETNLVNPPT